MIQFEQHSLQQSRSGSITGIVFFQFEDKSCFPCERWNDFVVVLANWWIDATNTLSSNDNNKRFQFMDGPYWIDLTTDGNTVRLACVDDHTPRTFPMKFEYDLTQLKADIASFAMSVWQSCKEREMASEDVRTLGGKLGIYE